MKCLDVLECTIGCKGKMDGVVEEETNVGASECCMANVSADWHGNDV